MRTAAQTLIAEAAGHLARCQRLLILTGAGASADAGIPTFRGEGGYWQERKAEDLASLAGFTRDPETVWAWYRERRMVVAEAAPHAGQRALALLQRHFPGRVLAATTNEDDLLDRAGVADVVHLHGSLFDSTCVAACGWSARDDADNSLSLIACPRCGAATRPGSVWYGEALPREPLARIADFDPDGCLVIGLSCLVQPVAGIPSELVNHGCPVVEVNPEETPITSIVLTSIRGTARAVLPPMVDLLTSHTVRDQIRRIT
jgi:NAD-dependent deacetylase